LQDDIEAAVEVIYSEYLLREAAGEAPALREFELRFPRYAERLRLQVELHRALAQVGPDPTTDPPSTAPSAASSAASEPAADAKDLDLSGGVFGPASADGQALERLGDYRILRKVGHGGMGVVYEAKQEALGRHVALKVLPFQFGLDPTRVQRFQREARSAARLHHTNIVPVFDVGEAQGIHYYAMQFIRGQGLDSVLVELRRLQAGQGAAAADAPAPSLSASLADGLRTGAFGAEGAAAGGERRPKDPLLNHSVGAMLSRPGSSAQKATSEMGRESMPPRTAQDAARSDFLPHADSDYHRSVARIGLQVAEALAYAHSQNVLHRDIKPSNLLLDIQGTVWVTDFGLAKDAGEALTRTGDMVGTLRYMAPERFDGTADARSDLYSLGLTLYELLTLRPAFDESAPARLIQQVTQDEPPRPRQVNRNISRDLETIVLKAMAKEPGQRYQSAEALAEDLTRFLASRPIQARPISGLERVVKWSRRRPALAALLGVSVLGILAAVAAVVGLVYNTRLSAAIREADVQRSIAQEQGALARRYRYGAEMNLAHRAWQENEVGRMVDLLTQQRLEQPGGEDFRGFEWYYLWRLCHSGLRTLTGHTERVLCARYSPDAKQIASGGYDCSIIIWDAATGQQIRTLRGHAECVAALSYSSKGLLASGSHDGTVKLWDAPTGREVHTLRGHKKALRSVAFSPDGQHLASGSYDGAIKVWDAISGLEIHTLQAHDDLVRSVTFSPDGRLLASASQDRTVKVWEVTTGRAIHTLPHPDVVFSVAFSPDGQRLASAGQDGTLRLWDTATGKEAAMVKGHSLAAFSIGFSPDGRRLVSAHFDGTVKVWDGATGELFTTLKGHVGYAWSAEFSPDGQRVASCGVDQTVRVWDVTKEQEAITLQSHTGAVSSVSFSPDGRRLAFGGTDHSIRIWDLMTSREILTLRKHSGPVSSVTFSSDGQRLASASRDGTINIWDARTGQHVLTLSGHRGAVKSVAFSPDGQRLASASEARGEVRVWNARSGQGLLSLKAFEARTVAFSPDGQRLVAAVQASRAEQNKRVYVWDVVTGRETLSLERHPTNITCWAIFSLDGKRLFTGDYDNSVIAWDATTGEELFTLKGHTTPVLSMAFSPDGNRIVSASGDAINNGKFGEVIVWDLITRQPILTLKGHTDAILDVAFSPDGQRLATASRDGTVKLWDAPLLTEGEER
jgi:WD40 repeat protein/serine/threonine protein kinase